MANNTNKYFTWYVKSRSKVCTFLGADEFDGFVSTQWPDRNGNDCYNFWDIEAKHPRTMVNGKWRNA
jgi:hypothetical protein